MRMFGLYMLLFLNCPTLTAQYVAEYALSKPLVPQTTLGKEHQNNSPKVDILLKNAIPPTFDWIMTLWASPKSSWAWTRTDNNSILMKWQLTGENLVVADYEKHVSEYYSNNQDHQKGIIKPIELTNAKKKQSVYGYQCLVFYKFQDQQCDTFYLCKDIPTSVTPGLMIESANGGVVAVHYQDGRKTHLKHWNKSKKMPDEITNVHQRFSAEAPTPRETQIDYTAGWGTQLNLD